MVTATTPRTIQLSRDQRYRLHVTAGATLIINGGRVRLHEPHSWLAETMLSGGQALQEGQSHQVLQSGWATLHAITATEVICCETAPTQQALLVRLLIRALRLACIIGPARRRPAPGSAAHD